MQSIANKMENTSHTMSKTGLPTGGKITISAFNPKTQLPVVCRPITDKSGRLASQGVPIIDYETSFVLEDGKVVDLDNPIEAANMKWVWIHPYLAVDKGKKTRDSVFYVVNAQKDAKMYVDKTAKIDEARPAVRKLSLTDQIRVAASLGLSAAHTFTPDTLLEWLLYKCNTDAGAVLDAINPENRARVTATIFFKDIEKWKVIERMRDGSFYFGGEKGVMVGHSDEVVISYLLAPENRERVKAMKAMLAEKTKVAQPEEVVI
jgi:hypothetical protein